MEPPPRPTAFIFQGIPLTETFTKNWEELQSFEAKPDDILIATYPKAGNTWLSYIVELLYFGQMVVPLQSRVPFLELTRPGLPSGKTLTDQLTTSPRIIKTHLPVQLVPRSFWEKNCRIISLARNAKDSAVSYFHFNRMNLIQPEPGDWSHFLQDFMDGEMVFGSWYDHVNGWWEKKQTYSNIHSVFYEDLIEDGGRELDRICSFLGLSPSPEEKEKVMAAAEFGNMKRNTFTNFSSVRSMNQEVSPFMRKGIVGDWKNHFTVAQNEKFDQDYERKMKNAALHFRTEL